MMKLRPIEWIVIVAIVATLLAFIAPESTGSRHYFSPSSLRSQYQRDNLLTPFFGRQAIEKSSALVDYLVERELWAPLSPGDSDWIQTAHFNPQWRDGQSYLHRVLYWDCDAWMTWTKENPKLANAVWPHVLAALRSDGSKHSACELLDLAKHSTSLEDFE